MSLLKSLFGLFAGKPKPAPAALVAPQKIQPNPPPPPVAVNPLSAQQAAALQAIWASAGSLEVTLAAGTVIWHGGTVPSAAALLDAVALWATSDQNSSTHYDAWAIGDAQRTGKTAHRLELSLRRPLRMADFACLSLQQFTMQHCRSHDGMKAALRAWCLQQGFDGAVNVNRVQYEVVICRPATELDEVVSVQLWP